MSTALSDGDQLKQKVHELSEMILAKHPRMPVLLREIHTTVRKYPEQVTLLDDKEIGIIVAGLQVQTNTSLVVSAAKPAAAKTLTSKIKQLGTGAF